jgi:DNA-binding NtrC family response regulator
MQEPIVVVDANEERCRELRTILNREKFQSSALHSLENLETNLQEGKCRVAILDLDSLPVDNRLFRNLKRTNPGVCIIGLSSRPFHPELEEAMSKHIHACLAKPVDEEELVYWVKSVCDV